MCLPRKIMRNEKKWELRPEDSQHLWCGQQKESCNEVWQEVAKEVEIEFGKNGLLKAKREEDFKKEEW